jgi:hypothetical protein
MSKSSDMSKSRTHTPFPYPVFISRPSRMFPVHLGMPNAWEPPMFSQIFLLKLESTRLSKLHIAILLQLQTATNHLECSGTTLSERKMPEAAVQLTVTLPLPWLPNDFLHSSRNTRFKTAFQIPRSVYR